MADILSACEEYGSKYRGGKYPAAENVRLIRAFVLLLRYGGGLHFGEAVKLERTCISGNKLILRSAKAGGPVCLALPDFVLAALAAVPGAGDRYFFCSDGSKVETAIRHWRQTLKGVFGAAGIPGACPHDFRKAFAARKRRSPESS